MYIPTHYVVLFVAILLCESTALFIYTIIGLVKSNPLPYMIPLQQSSQHQQQQQQFQQSIPYCQPYQVTIPQQPQNQIPNNQLFTVPAIEPASTFLTLSTLESSSPSSMPTTVTMSTTSAAPPVTTTVISTSVQGIQSGELPNILPMETTAKIPTSSSSSQSRPTSFITVRATPSKSSTTSKYS